MTDSVEERIQKVKTLYERTTNLGEKAAAYMALKRLLNKNNEDESSQTDNWLMNLQQILIEKGFYLCLIVGNSYLYSKVRQRDGEKVRLTRLSHSRGNWDYYKAYNGRKFVFTDRRPDNTGKSKDQLKKILK